MTRRTLLAGMGAVPAFAQRAKGPKVFLDYDQAELDAAYNQASYAPNMQQLQARARSNSELIRARLGEPMRSAYGPTEIERLDIYRAKGEKMPVQVFIHGGAWQGLSARSSAFPAEMFIAAGAHYVTPDFVAVQNAGGSLNAMADQVPEGPFWHATMVGVQPEIRTGAGHLVTTEPATRVKKADLLMVPARAARHPAEVFDYVIGDQSLPARTLIASTSPLVTTLSHL